MTPESAHAPPNAALIIYPDSGHGSLFQYPGLLVAHVTRFLDSSGALTQAEFITRDEAISTHPAVAASPF